MKIRSCILFTFITFLASAMPTYASEVSENACIEKHEKLYCGAVELDHLRYLGDVVLNGTTVKGALSVTGDLEMHRAHVNQMNIIGDLHADDSEVNGESYMIGDTTLSNMHFKANARLVGDVKASKVIFDTTSNIVGYLDISDSKFNGILTLAADKVYFANTTSLTIDYTHSDKPQNLYLNLNSYVNGDINFPSNRGTVYVRTGSRIGGKVNGGKIIIN